jgi:hypothetical protein
MAMRNGMEFYFETDKASDQVVAHSGCRSWRGRPSPTWRFSSATATACASRAVDGQRPSGQGPQVDVKSVPTLRRSEHTAGCPRWQGCQCLIGNPRQPRHSSGHAGADALLATPTSDATELQTPRRPCAVRPAGSSRPPASVATPIGGVTAASSRAGKARAVLRSITSRR